MLRTHRHILPVGSGALLLLTVASCGGGDTSGPATVAVASVSVSPSTAAVDVGATTQLSATALDAKNGTLSGRVFSWSTSSAAVATVGTSGLVTGVAPGNATITATSEGKSGSAVVTVTTPAFAPGSSTSLGGIQSFTTVNIPAGVTVTVSSNLVLNATSAVTIAGTLAGDCKSISINSEAAVTLTGTIANDCAGTLPDSLPRLRVFAKGGMTASGTIRSTGDVLITDDTTLTAASFEQLPLASSTTPDRANATVLCFLDVGANFPKVPETAKAGKDQQFGTRGDDGSLLDIRCAAGIELSGGSSITGQNGGPGGNGTHTSSTFADSKGGDGGHGGTVRLQSAGTITFGGDNVIRSGAGGAGGSATSTATAASGVKAPSAQAIGGKGGNSSRGTGIDGPVYIRAAAIDIKTQLTLVVGNAGAGGAATAKAAAGADAGAQAAQDGGNSTATGGAGGKSIPATLNASGAVSGSVIVTGGNGGVGGIAAGFAGNGGNGNQQFKPGGNGGKNATQGGLGGDADVRNLAGNLVGNGGNGGRADFTDGSGGKGFMDCADPRQPGGNGGTGGAASGGDGVGGKGLKNGDAGNTTTSNVANGGDGGKGEGPGTGGTAGANGIVTKGSNTPTGKNFQKGVDGSTCTPIPKKAVSQWKTTEVDQPKGFVGSTLQSTSGVVYAFAGSQVWQQVGTSFVAETYNGPNGPTKTFLNTATEGIDFSCAAGPASVGAVRNASLVVTRLVAKGVSSDPNWATYPTPGGITDITCNPAFTTSSTTQPFGYGRVSNTLYPYYFDGAGPPVSLTGPSSTGLSFCGGSMLSIGSNGEIYNVNIATGAQTMVAQQPGAGLKIGPCASGLQYLFKANAFYAFNPLNKLFTLSVTTAFNIERMGVSGNANRFGLLNSQFSSVRVIQISPLATIDVNAPYQLRVGSATGIGAAGDLLFGGANGELFTIGSNNLAVPSNIVPNELSVGGNYMLTGSSVWRGNNVGGISMASFPTAATGNETWTKNTTPNTNPVVGISGLSSTEIYAGTILGEVWTPSGNNWVPLSTTLATNLVKEAVAVGQNTVGLFGLGGYAATYTGAGIGYASRVRAGVTTAASLTPISSGVTANLNQACVTRVATSATPAQYAVVGDGGTLLRGVGTALATIPLGTTAHQTAVGCLGDDAFTVGDDRIVRDLNLSTSTPPAPVTLPTIPGTWTIHAIVVNAATDIYVGGDGGNLLRWDGTSWTAMPTNTLESILRIVLLPSGGAVAVGSNGMYMVGIP
jgi:hypothetical protein